VQRTLGRQHAHALAAAAQVKRLNVLALQAIIPGDTAGSAAAAAAAAAGTAQRRMRAAKTGAAQSSGPELAAHAHCETCGTTLLAESPSLAEVAGSEPGPVQASTLRSSRVCVGCATTRVALRLSVPRQRSRVRGLSVRVWRADIAAAREVV
jgi:hypothetical protein